METHAFSKTSIAIFAAFALVLLGLDILRLSSAMNMFIIIGSAVLCCIAVVWVEEKRTDRIV